MAEQHVGARAVEVMAPNGLPACFGTKPRIARLAIDGPPIRRPMNNLDGWGTARKMIELYGKEAQCEARRRCEKAFQRDGMSGVERWAHIATVIGGHLSRSAVQPVQLGP